MMIATFSVGRARLATAEVVACMMTDEHWLPYESLADRLLLEAAIRQHRRFTKSLRDNLAPDRLMPAMILTDTPSPTAAYILEAEENRAAAEEHSRQSGTNTWAWVTGESIPRLPPAVPRPARDKAGVDGGPSGQFTEEGTSQSKSGC